MKAIVTADSSMLNPTEGLVAAAPAAVLDALFRTHHAHLYRLARRLSGDRDEALDLVQETFLRAARRPQSVPQGDGAAPWLVRTLVNLCRDRWRRLEVRSRNAEAATPASEASDLESAALARAAVQAALARLAPRRRAVVVLHELEGLDAAEIARLLGVTRVTVRWHLSAGRRELKRLLAPAQAALEGSAP
jgi:RNA polymerase sigma-70 factor (ECF subfamily)